MGLKPAPEGGLAVFGGESEGWWDAGGQLGFTARFTFEHLD
jgi:hypothetical protein